MDVSLVDEERYPLVTDMTFVPTMHAEILHAEILQDPDQWATPKLYAAVEFAWGILLRECAGRTVFTGEVHVTLHLHFKVQGMNMTTTSKLLSGTYI